MEDLGVEIIDALPKKRMKRTSRVNVILQKLYDQVPPGKIGKFDPTKAKVNPHSLRWQLRYNLKLGLFTPGTKILSRGKEWYFVKGK
jgi:hypothetical protein